MLATITLSTAFVLAPAPRWAMAEEMAVDTARVTLHASEADRSKQAVATSGLDASEAAVLQAARHDPERLTTGVRGKAVRAVGVTVDALPAAPVLVRARVGGVWTPWFEVPFGDGESPDVGSSERSAPLTSAPVWLGEADAYELDGPPDLTSLSVHEVIVEKTARKLAVGDAAGAAGAPAILSRSSWGARPPKTTPSTTADLKLAIVHHSATGNTYSSSQVPSVIRSIQAYHMDANGWDDIAYNFVVDRFGRIWEGRAGGTTNVVLGGHSQGFNTGTTGVVVLGDFTTTTAPSAAIEAVAQTIAWKLAIHRVDPGSTVPYTTAGSNKYAAGTTVTLPRIIGHRDVQTTGCPGVLYGRLGAIRQRVAQLVPGYLAGSPPDVAAADVDANGMVDPLEYHPGTTSDRRWRPTGAGTFVQERQTINNTYRLATGDFDGDGREDTLFHGTGSAPDSIVFARATGPYSKSYRIGGSHVIRVGDFDGNGVDDLLLYTPGPGADAVWYFLPGGAHLDVRPRQDLVTGVPLIGDFSGDGRDDVFWYGPGSATDEAWLSTGRAWRFTRPPAVKGLYTPVVLRRSVGPNDEILWIQPGQSVSYRGSLTSSGTWTSRPMSTPAPNGRPFVGDFDGDGRDDVLLYGERLQPDWAWYSQPDGGVLVKPQSIDGMTVIAVGQLDLGRPDDILLVGSTTYLRTGHENRTFTSRVVG